MIPPVYDAEDPTPLLVPLLLLAFLPSLVYSSSFFPTKTDVMPLLFFFREGFFFKLAPVDVLFTEPVLSLLTIGTRVPLRSC